MSRISGVIGTPCAALCWSIRSTRLSLIDVPLTVAATPGLAGVAGLAGALVLAASQAVSVSSDTVPSSKVADFKYVVTFIDKVLVNKIEQRQTGRARRPSREG